MERIQKARWPMDEPMASARDAGNRLRAQLLESVTVRGDEERALGLAIDAVFGAWERLGLEGDADRFVDYLNNPWLLDTLEAQLMDTTGKAGPAFELYRDWLTPFRRPRDPADPLSGQIDSDQIKASLGGYMRQLVALAHTATSGMKPVTKAVPSNPIPPETQGAETMKQDEKWFDKSTPRGRRQRVIFAVIVAVMAIAWAHHHWSHPSAGEDGPAAAQSTTRSN